MNHQILTFGELLLRFSPPFNRRLMQTDALEMHWAGSEANVAVSLANFGESVAFLTAVPDNEIGKIGINMVRRFGVDVSRTRWEGERLGIFYYEPGAGVRGGRIVYDRKYSSFSVLRPGMIDWEEAFRNCNWFHWSGINAGISQELADVCREALETARRLNITISADCNHRHALWKYGKEPGEIMAPLLNHCDLLVADMSVGKMYYGIEPDKDNSPESFLKNLSVKFPEHTSLALTMRGKINGSGSDTDYTGYYKTGNDVFISEKFSVENTVERIGSGDAFMAGLIYGKRQGMDSQRLINYAAAAGAIKHTFTGDFNLATVAEVASLGQQRAGTILR